MAELILNKDNFDKEVLGQGKTVVVDFWAPWCTPCRMMESVMTQVAEESDGSYAVGKVNVDDEEELAMRFGIMSIPAIKVFRNGEIVASTIGFTSPKGIKEMINM